MSDLPESVSRNYSSREQGTVGAELSVLMKQLAASRFGSLMSRATAFIWARMLSLFDGITVAATVCIFL